ncbi:glycosyl transferase family 2 [Nostoc sp. T09]|uniref:glycosyltransferase family 2 protein n=1 Tax=Nostoc sp. T09 TaxID=1932621 RepID=UPI000A3C080F|nr:glycosyltransferase family 2 protein [Nostoc sp. T09]OUL28418.1 glycosyl transferase family 2 [Nostoc sp. T09]
MGSDQQCYQTSLGPLVSVIVPAYNAEKFIQKTLHSILSQTYKNIEVLVVDDGSQDRTAEIVQSIALNDQRVILLQQPNSGVAAARNLAIQNSQGEFIAPIDADDIWYPQNLERQVQCILEGGRDIGLVYAWSMDIDENDTPTGGFRVSHIEGNVYKTLLCHYFLGNASACLIRSTCFEKVGGYNCNLKANNAQGCEDWELSLRIAEHYRFKVVPEFLIGYRQICSSMSGNYQIMAKSHQLMLDSVQQKHPEISRFLYRLSSSSFYMYLARQSSQSGSDRNTLFWLVQALKSNLFTPILHLSLYTLSIKSIFRSITKSLPSVIFSQQDIFIRLIHSIKKTHKYKYTNITKINKPQLNIQVKILFSSMLHRAMKLI